MGPERRFAARHAAVSGLKKRRRRRHVFAVCGLCCALVGLLGLAAGLAGRLAPHEDHAALEASRASAVVDDGVPIQGFRAQSDAEWGMGGEYDPNLVLFSMPNCAGEVLAEVKPDGKGDEALHSLCEIQAGSMRLERGPEVDFYSSCLKDTYYVGSLFASEG